MEGKVILVTGATDGIGKQTALELARLGATVLVHGRSLERGRAVVERIHAVTGHNKIELFVADLSSQRQVRELAAAVWAMHGRLDVLINNAGVYMKERHLTEDGFEVTFAVNHLAPFLLTNLLLDLLRASAPARVVTVSSVAHQRARVEFDNLQGEKRYDSYGAYALSKLGNVLFSYELAARLDGTGVTSNSLHPGVISTKLLRAGFSRSGDSLEAGAATPVYLASSPVVATVTGKYFVDKRETRSAPATYDISLRARFWQVSALLTGLAE